MTPKPKSSPHSFGVELRASYHGPARVRLLLTLLVILAGLTAPIIDGMADAHADESAGAHHSARILAAAQRRVAKHPNAHGLAKRSIVDCEGQFG